MVLLKPKLPSGLCFLIAPVLAPVLISSFLSPGDGKPKFLLDQMGHSPVGRQWRLITQTFRTLFQELHQATVDRQRSAVQEARNSSNGGIGLGLAIAQRAVGIHHGSVWAENASPGLRVFIDLP